MSFEAFLITDDESHLDRIKKNLKTRVLLVDGKCALSFSWMVNECIEICSSNRVLIMSDRVTPNDEHINQTMRLMDDGFAFVGLYRFAFFCLDKYLVELIGWFDEGFIGGGYEDDDYIRRMRESDIGFYESEIVPYKRGKSKWDITSKERFIEKWGEWPGMGKRKKRERRINRKLDGSHPKSFLAWKDSVVIPSRKWILE